MAKACATCRTRLLVLRGFPPLDAKPSQDGKVAVTFTDPVQARWLARSDEPTWDEHRHAPHECPPVAEPEGLRGAEFRDAWQTAAADHHRHQRSHRGRRPAPEISGVVVKPAELPLDGER